MQCPKCQGKVFEDEDGLFCFICGWRPVTSAPTTRIPNIKKKPELSLRSLVLQIFLRETHDEAEELKQLLQQKRRLLKLFKRFWRRVYSLQEDIPTPWERPAQFLTKQALPLYRRHFLG